MDTHIYDFMTVSYKLLHSRRLKFVSIAVYLLIHLVTHVTMDTSITVHSLYIKKQLLI
jgi:hypothetical protein